MGSPGVDSLKWVRPVRPGDIMVLVRRRNQFLEELVRELKSRGVPVAGVDRMVLRDQLAVMDLMALGLIGVIVDDESQLNDMRPVAPITLVTA